MGPRRYNPNYNDNEVRSVSFYHNKTHKSCPYMAYSSSKNMYSIKHKDRKNIPYTKKNKSSRNLYKWNKHDPVGLDRYLEEYAYDYNQDDTYNNWYDEEEEVVYATGQIILDKKIREEMTDGQHFAWRCTEWNNIESKVKPSIYKDKSFLKNFMDMDPDYHRKCTNFLIEHYYMSVSEFPLGNERIIAIDSSFLTEVPTDLFMKTTMRADPPSETKIYTQTNIFLETYIPLIESLFKLNNQHRDDYQNIEFERIHTYIQYSEGRPDTEVGMKLRCSKYETHLALKKREDEFFRAEGLYTQYNGIWSSGTRNMINDHVIVDLLLATSAKMPTSVPIIATNDLKMIEYAIQNNVYYITYTNNVFYSNYPIHGIQLISS